ncbi:MAG: hypothetical protein A2Y38_23500 [Spirochaetes bacterium GWB1_59_5]|nr:MAG: hypothetical protein A2Y38_23500 [Spirochaetes bacterium GWB1_59_5]
MPKKTKTVKRGEKRLPAKARAALAFVRELAKDWVRDGRSGDEPGRAKEAHDLLVEHGETVS